MYIMHTECGLGSFFFHLVFKSEAQREEGYSLQSEDIDCVQPRSPPGKEGLLH